MNKLKQEESHLGTLRDQMEEQIRRISKKRVKDDAFGAANRAAKPSVGQGLRTVGKAEIKGAL